MNSRALFIFILIQVGAFVAWAAPEKELAPTEMKASADEFYTHEEPTHIQFFVSGEYLSLDAPGATLSGFGPSLGARFAFSRDWFVTASASQLMDASAGLTSSLSSTLRASIYYCLGGPLGGYTTETAWNGKPFMRMHSRGDSGFALGVSSSANFLTGNKTVLAAPGFSGNALYQTSLFNLTWLAEVRFGAYSINGTSSSGMGASLGFLFF